MAQKTGTGPDSDPNKRFDLAWDPTHVWMTSFVDNGTTARSSSRVARRPRSTSSSCRSGCRRRCTSIDVSPAVGGARHRSRNGHHVLPVHDHRKGGLLMAVDGRFRAVCRRRQKVMVFVRHRRSCSALLYWQFVFKGLKEDLDRGRERARSEDRAQQEARGATSRSSRSSRRGWRELKRMIDENQKALPTEAELPAFFEMLEPQGARVGRRGRAAAKQGKEEPIETFVKVPVEYRDQRHVHADQEVLRVARAEEEAAGRRDRRARDNVEEKERIVSIENLSLVEPDRAQPRDSC